VLLIHFSGYSKILVLDGIGVFCIHGWSA